MVKIKICGLKEVEHVKVCVEAGATWIGFMFAESKRQISLEQAKLLSKQVPSHIKKVGVFVNPTADEVHTAVKEVGLDFVQYHGKETPDFISSLGYPSIKAFSIRSKEDVEKAKEYNVDYYLFDSPGTKFAGGSGKVFDWSLLEQVSIPKERVILAGGLNSDNVKDAVNLVQPFGVDVSSGVELNGQKNSELIKQFIQIASTL